MNMRKVLFDNWLIKLMSLLLSLSLWFYVTSKGKMEISITAPIELQNIPQGLAVVGDVVGFLDVRVQGQERVLRDITTGKRVVGMLDLSLMKPGENTLHLSPDDIRRPAGVSVTHISPAEIRVRLDSLTRKTFRLWPVLHGVPDAGFKVRSITVKPARITVEGPAGVMASFARLQTMPIDIQGARNGAVTVEPKIDYDGKPIKLLEHDITVTVYIERVRK